MRTKSAVAKNRARLLRIGRWLLLGKNRWRGRSRNRGNEGTKGQTKERKGRGDRCEGDGFTFFRERQIGWSEGVVPTEGKFRL